MVIVVMYKTFVLCELVCSVSLSDLKWNTYNLSWFLFHFAYCCSFTKLLANFLYW